MLLRPLARVIARLDGDGARFLSELGIDASTPDDAYIEAALTDRALANVAAERGDPCFGLTLAQSAVEHPVGFFDHLVWPGATVRDAILRSARFYGLITQRATLQFEEHASVATLTHVVHPEATRGVVLTELAFASLVLRSRIAAGGFEVRGMRFAHAVDSAAHDTYQRVFGIAVQFEQTADVLALDSCQLDRPLGTADPVAAIALEARALKMGGAQRPTDPFLDEVRAVMAQRIGDPSTSLARVAAALQLTEEALQARLEESGTSLRSLVDDVRKGAAMNLLERGVSSAAVASELGFSHAPAFHKAFVRWTGMTPSAFRVRQE